MWLQRLRPVLCGIFLALSCVAVASGQVVAPEALARSIEAWRGAPEGWKGLSERGALRFNNDLDGVVAVASDSEAVWRVVLGAAALDFGRAEPGELARVGEHGRQVFTRLLGGSVADSLRRWSLGEVLVDFGGDRRRRSTGAAWRATIGERSVCLDALLATHPVACRTALLVIARSSTDPLRVAAFRALARWSKDHGADEAIDLFLVRKLGERFDPTARPHPFNVLLERVQPGGAPLADRAGALLLERLQLMLISADWRETARALRLSAGIDIQKRVPMLLDALSVWDRREQRGSDIAGLVRIQGDLVRALQALSLRRHGSRPAPWIDWWIAVRQGREPMPGTPEFEEQRKARAAQPRSSASFFGLRPASNRVTFVLDFSGSMERGWGTSGHSRYVEAVDQLMRFLQGAGAGTYFNIILFSDEPLISSDELVEATPENLELARASLLRRTPQGGTHLRQAVELALKYSRGAGPDLEALEADTVVVLCDGETAEGRRWVAPFLDLILPAHPVVFHSVHLGTDDDGALESLARISGGDFLRVGG